MKALVVAGGLPQIVLINELKKRGIETVLIDGNPSPLARPYADQFYQINVFDMEGVKEIAVKEKVDFLITVCADQILLVVAKISEELGLPCYVDYETAKLVSDKKLMKKRFIERGIPTTRFVIMESFDASLAKDLQYPLIVKPVDAYSSKGVRKVMNAGELQRAFEEAKAISRAKNVIVEEFFEGEEISVDLFVKNGKAEILCLSNCDEVKDEDHVVIFRGRCPVHASETLKKKVREVCQQIADAFTLKNSPMLVQMLTDGERISVLEFCARTGGAMKWLLIKYASDVDVIPAVIDLTLGKEAMIDVKSPKHAFIVNDFIYCREGIYDHLEGFEEQLRLGNITDYHCLRPIKTKFSGHVLSSTDRIAGVTIQADSLEELNLKQAAFVQGVRVIDENGRDMMRHDLFPDLKES